MASVVGNETTCQSYTRLCEPMHTIKLCLSSTVFIQFLQVYISCFSYHTVRIYSPHTDKFDLHQFLTAALLGG